ncbi:MAG: hypothetical protein ACYTBX_00975 [Planctomycetota bacterium]|jgi:hypothetical protein
MSNQNEENLKELFERFADAEQAEKHIQDVQKAEQILREYPAPEPGDMLIANIKAEIAMRLPARRTDVFKRTVYKAAAVAAAVVIVAAVSLRLFEQGDVEPERVIYASLIPRVIWESDDIATDDADLAIFTAEVEQIEDEVLALQFGENGGNGSRAVSELEMELIAIEGDFWKG